MSASVTEENSKHLPLPIDPHLQNITEKILGDLPVILTASAGSGKTTRLPPFLLKAITSEKKYANGKIIVIVPKRLAAVAACDRIAEENNWQVGREVGYQVRFESMLGADTRLIFMTEGYFLKKISDKNFLEDIGFLILDEFHERSSQIDLILGIGLEQKLLTDKPQIVVMSATLNTQKLKTFFDQSTHIDVQAPPFPLNLYYSKKNQNLTCDKDFYESVKSTAIEAWKISKKDILVFLPGFREMLRAKEVLAPVFSTAPIEFIYGSMKLEDQKRILQKQPTQSRRILLATNIAESSLTLPDLDCVIDCGLEKNVRYEKKLGFSKLELQRISKFSATQRAGRAARNQEGFCFRLWHESDNLSMPEQKKPQVLTSPLHEEILCLYELGIRPQQFSWLDKPEQKNLLAAELNLQNWQLIEHRSITAKGHAVSRIPLDTDKSVLFYELCLLGFLTEASVLLAKLETLDFAKLPNVDPHSTAVDSEDDLDLILKTPANDKQKRIERQLQQIANALQLNVKKSTTTDIRQTLLKIFLKNFPQKLIQRKSEQLGVSSFGRGVEFATTSKLSLKNSDADYGLAFAGYEKSDAVTVLQSCLGYSKEQILHEMAATLTTTTEVHYNAERSTFQKKDVQKFGNFIFKESATQNLSNADINVHWKKFVTEAPSEFLQLNQSYPRLMEKLEFLKNKAAEMQIEEFTQSILNKDDFISKLADVLVNSVTGFTEFKAADLIYYLDTVLPSAMLTQLKLLPNSVLLPSGKSVAINYTDPKAPLISAKIQDCMGWKTTPKLLDKILYTIELLAPNMRPAQTTNNLETFWKTSYLDVRKDLRARYPKHHWPEDPISHPKKT